MFYHFLGICRDLYRFLNWDLLRTPAYLLGALGGIRGDLLDGLLLRRVKSPRPGVS